jgi:hypothetical protein
MRNRQNITFDTIGMNCAYYHSVACRMCSSDLQFDQMEDAGERGKIFK